MQVLCSGVSATRDTSVPDVYLRRGLQREIVQVDISGTATVQLFGRLSDDMDWVQVGDDFTASGFVEVAWIPQLRVKVSAYTSGTIDVSITGEAP